MAEQSVIGGIVTARQRRIEQCIDAFYDHALAFHFRGHWLIEDSQVILAYADRIGQGCLALVNLVEQGHGDPQFGHALLREKFVGPMPEFPFPVDPLDRNPGSSRKCSPKLVNLPDQARIGLFPALPDPGRCRGRAVLIYRRRRSGRLRNRPVGRGYAGAQCNAHQHHQKMPVIFERLTTVGRGNDHISF